MVTTEIINEVLDSDPNLTTVKYTSNGLIMKFDSKEIVKQIRLKLNP